MTDRQEILDRINELMVSTDLSYDFKDATDIESFLENDENQQYEEYEEVEKLYEELVEISEYEVE
jgi:hypothetical protein